VVAVVVAGAMASGYDSSRDTISLLASSGRPHALGVRLAFIAYGLLVVAGAPAFDAVWIGWWSRSLVRVFGVCAVVIGLAPKHRAGSPSTLVSDVHVAVAVIGGAAIVLAMACVAVRSGPTRPRVAAGVAASMTIVLAAAFRQTWGTDVYGALERLVIAIPVAWLSWPRSPPERSSKDVDELGAVKVC
jgi:hypothetical protein